MALGTFERDYVNKVKLLQLDLESRSYRDLCELEHPYPATDIAWAPPDFMADFDGFVTTGDYLRLWRLSSTASDSGRGSYSGEIVHTFNSVFLSLSLFTCIHSLQTPF